MKYSTKLSDAVHVMVLIAINQEKSLSSASIAESVHTNPGFVRQLMLKLKKAELMTSVAGHARPSLSKPLALTFSYLCRDFIMKFKRLPKKK